LYYFELEDGLIAEFLRRTPPDVIFDVISFQRENRKPSVVDAWQEMTSNRSGKYVEIATDADLSKITAATEELLSEVLTDNTIAVECDRDFIIEPYSSTTIVSAVRPNVESSVQLVDPNGNI
ncbi:MAG: hypothetical protein CUN55_20375, partial [Phototrophicales bacterium]